MIKTARIYAHPKFVQARNELDDLCRSSKPGSLIFLIGPSGAGKTEICFDVMSSLAGDFSKWGRGRLPISYVLAVQSDKNFFSPKHFMSSLFRSVCAPNIDWLIPRGKSKSEQLRLLEDEVENARSDWLRLPHRSSEMDLRDAFISCARARQLKYLFVDDARAMTVQRGAPTLAEHLLSYMTLAAEADLVICFIGTHVISRLLQGVSEPRRRTEDVFVDRYRQDHVEDRSTLVSICMHIAREFPNCGKKFFIENLALIELATGGVYEEAAKLLRRAERHRRSNGPDQISKENLEASIYREDLLKDMWRDLHAFDALRIPTNLCKAVEFHQPRRS